MRFWEQRGFLSKIGDCHAHIQIKHRSQKSPPEEPVYPVVKERLRQLIYNTITGPYDPEDHGYTVLVEPGGRREGISSTLYVQT